MDIDKISTQILQICESEKLPYKENKSKLNKLYFELEGCFSKIVVADVGERAIGTLISLHRELSGIRNRKASYVEEEIARLILARLPMRIRNRDGDIPEGNEELKDEIQEGQRPALRMSSALLKYAKEIVVSNPDKSKRYKNRVREALRILDELQHFYIIPDIKGVFLSKITDKDKDLQFFALYGLENYYAYKSADKLTKEEEEGLRAVIKTTKARENASTACQILVNAGKIGEFTAVIMMDDWKDENWR